MSAVKPALSDIPIRSKLRCGDLGRIIELHGRMYSEEAGFGLRFEAFVAGTIAEYVLDNNACGRIWLAEDGDILAGCVAVAERPGNTGQLRWVLVDARYRGLGLGRRLVGLAMDYCIERGLDTIRLETTDGLPESASLYARLGFRTISEEPAELWSGRRTLIRMEKPLAAGRDTA
jgi:GNAT superfamily N-acetyltransferase